MLTKIVTLRELAATEDGEGDAEFTYEVKAFLK